MVQENMYLLLLTREKFFVLQIKLKHFINLVHPKKYRQTNLSATDISRFGMNGIKDEINKFRLLGHALTVLLDYGDNIQVKPKGNS